MHGSTALTALRITFAGKSIGNRQPLAGAATMRRVVVLRGGFPMIQKVSPAVCGDSHVEGSEVVELLREMKDHLVADFGFGRVQLAGEAPINRTTEPVVRFLLWLERTPEARAALRLAFQRLAGKLHLG
jgi:hypothetical protein